MTMTYPEEWDQLPKHERKKKLKQLRRKQENKASFFHKARNAILAIIAIVAVIGGYKLLSQKSPEQMALRQAISSASLDGRVEEFAIEGRNHVLANTVVTYKTNPPTSGNHLAQAKGWGVYSKEIDDKAAVHGLEHGGVWISYKDLSENDVNVLKKIGKKNSRSVIVSPRNSNESKIAVVSWGRMMKLDAVDEAAIQKYINTYKNKSPEKLAQ